MQVCQSAFCILQSALLHFALNAVWNSKSSSVHSQLVCCPSICARAPSSRGGVVLRVTARESETFGTSQGVSCGKGADTLQFFWVCPSWLGGEKRLFCSPARWRCVLWSAAQVVPGKGLGAWEGGRSERNALGSF